MFSQQNSAQQSAIKFPAGQKQPGSRQTILVLTMLFTGILIVWLISSPYLHKPFKDYSWYGFVNSLADRGSVLWTDLSKRLPITTSSPLEDLTGTPPILYTDKPNSLSTSVAIASVDRAIVRQTMLSIEELNKQAAQLGEEPSYHNRLGLLYEQIDDFSYAIKQYNQAISLCRKQIWQKSHQVAIMGRKDASSVDLSSIYVELTCAHSNLARLYDKLGDHERVVAEIRELNSDINGNIATDSMVIAKNSAPEAVNLPAQKGPKLTENEAAHLAKAEALRQVGRFAEAIQEYQQLIKENPSLAIAHQRLGLLAAATNDLWLAMSELQTAGMLDPKDADTQNDLGLIYLQLGDIPLAKYAFRQAHAIDPGHLDAAINLADVLASTGNIPSALHVMREAVGYNYHSATAHNNLGAVLLRLGDDRGAAKEFAGALSLNSALASAHYGLGTALLNLKSYAQAITEFKAAMKLNPGFLDLQNKIDLANRCNLNCPPSSQEIEN